MTSLLLVLTLTLAVLVGVLVRLVQILRDFDDLLADYGTDDPVPFEPVDPGCTDPACGCDRARFLWRARAVAAADAAEVQQ